MKKTLLFLLIMITPLFGEMTNKGEDRELVFSPNVLSGTRAPGDMLYCPSEADDAGYRAAIAALTGSAVDYFDTRAATPTLAELQNYDCVYTWANFSYFDNVAMGDVLADYVDGGGTVVLGAFCTYTSGSFLSGRIMTVGYNPVVSPTGSNHFLSSNYAGDGTTAIHNGVTAYECLYRDILVLQGAGMQDGSYLDGEIATAYRPDFKVIYTNGSGAAALGCTGDWPELIANACAAGGGLSSVPTMGKWGLGIFIGLFVLGGLFFIKRK